MNARVERLRARVDEPFLVTDALNVRYLTGFVSSNAAVLIEADRVRLFTDFRYAERARSLDGVEAVETPRNVFSGLAELLSGRIAFEADTLTFAAYETLRDGGLELVPTRGVVLQLRAVKDDTELDAMRRAAAIGDHAFERLADERFTGRTERELAWRMEELLHEEGAEAASFPVIVAGGATGATPHAVPGDRALHSGETIVVDSGCKVDGYSSDCTRTFATGPLDGRLRDAYAVCLEAQTAALEAVRPGAHGRDVDSVARERIDATEFRGLFGHGLGHGVGLAVHEAPVLRPESEDTLEPGNVVTVEPGIYLPGVGGIRIEDLVIVTDAGCEVLTPFSKDLIEVQ